MARLPRLYAPGLPQLVQANFIQPLTLPSQPIPTDTLNQVTVWLGETVKRHEVALHGWALTLERILLLASPTDPTGLPRLMQALGRNLAARLQRGRIFAGRYRSTLVEPGEWVLPTLIWLETYPVRQGMTPAPARWPWSSAAGHSDSGLSSVAWISDHVDYLSCGLTAFDRQTYYHRKLQAGLSTAQIQRIEQAIQGQWALGEPDFIATLTHTASRRVTPGQRGRPRKKTYTLPVMTDAT
jgi:putative transposase